jgi:hypothetical protein
MKSNQFSVVKFYCKQKQLTVFTAIYICLHCLFTYFDWQVLLKSPRCDIIDWHYDRGLNNSKLTVWSLITVADGSMRVWHFNRVITTYGKRDCRNSWRYESLAVNRGAIKRGFTVYTQLASVRGMISEPFPVKREHIYTAVISEMNDNNIRTTSCKREHILPWNLLGHAIMSIICFDLQFSRITRPMTSFCVFIAYINTEGILFNVKITRWD